MERNKFIAKGIMLFFISKDNEIYHVAFDEDYYHERYKEYGDIGELMLKDKYEKEFNFDIYDLIPGKEFLESVQDKCFTDYDGHICQVFVDGFKSNIGLISDNLISGGDFYMDADAWNDLCDNYEVFVNWANK